MLYSKPQWPKATIIYSHRHAGQGWALLISPGLPHVLGVGGGWLIGAGRSALSCKSAWVWATCLSSSLDRELAHVCSSYGYSRDTSRQAKRKGRPPKASDGLGQALAPSFHWPCAPQPFFVIVPLSSLLIYFSPDLSPPPYEIL